MKERQAENGRRNMDNLKNVESGSNDHIPTDKTTTRKELANIAGTSEASVQRTKLILEKGTPEQSDRQIATSLGVSHVTVGSQRREMESIGQLDQCDRQTSDVRKFRTSLKPPTLLEEYIPGKVGRFSFYTFLNPF